MAVIDEDWSLVEDTLWAFAIAVQVENTTEETILVADCTFTNLDDGDRNDPLHERFRDIWPAVSRETKRLFDVHLNDSHSGIFESDILFNPNQPEVLWYIGEALPPRGGGRPRFTFTLEDSLGNSYDMDVDQRPAQRFRAS
jgi:diadenosine tetraphosphatase ApaH/serine/threonine PP2A family protein phosphatase